jgi:hypothetical protein
MGVIGVGASPSWGFGAAVESGLFSALSVIGAKSCKNLSSEFAGSAGTVVEDAASDYTPQSVSLGVSSGNGT